MVRRRKTRKRKEQPVVIDIAVCAVAASVSRSAPGVRLLPGSDCYSHLYIKGTLPKPVIRDVRTVIISVFEDRPGERDPGSAIGFGAESWTIVARLPRAQFADLLVLALSGKLHRVSIDFDSVKRGKGDITSVSYWTRQIPLYAEDDEVVS